MQTVLNRIVELCETGFDTRNRSLYVVIERTVDEIKSDHPKLLEIKRLASAGPTLVSDRFAFPHIRSAALDLLAELQKEDSK